jgi:hypothetical protein
MTLLGPALQQHFGAMTRGVSRDGTEQDMPEITIIGGGLAGLTAAVACAEAGADVVVHEAHATLGGRARTSESPWLAQEGPHAFYTDGPHWRWLVERDLVGPAAGFPLREIRGTWFHRGGRLRRTPPADLLTLLAHRRRRAPVDVDFRTWVAALHGEEAARTAANLLGVITFDPDPGRLSAAFAWNLLLRVTAPGRPIVRWPVGGWPSVVDRLARRARELGVRIATSSRVDALPGGPVVVATQLESARSLLGDDSLTWESGRCVMLDVGLVPDRGDAFFIADIDDSGLVERVTGVDATLAPAGHALVQADMPLKQGEPRDTAYARLEHLLDLGLPQWRERAVWRRRGVADGRSGALDLPGCTWRDRPAVDRGDGVFLVGDLVAAPGFRAEVSINSALHAAQLVTARSGAGARIAR